MNKSFVCFVFCFFDLLSKRMIFETLNSTSISATFSVQAFHLSGQC